MSSLTTPLLWIVGVAFLYGAVAVAALLISLAVRAPQPAARIGGLGAIVLTAAALAVTLRGPSPIIFASVFFATWGLLSGLYRFVVRPALDWKALKLTGEIRRQTVLHLTLISGSALFLVPFVWLVSTSLKEDKEMSKFPPVWIPTQQVMVNIDGAPHGKSRTVINGQPAVVAIMEEFDTGFKRVRALEPANIAGQEFQVKKDDLTEIRHISPVWKNYPDALKFLPPDTNKGLVFLKNTLLVSGLSIAGTLLSSAMVAYGFARLRWPGRDTLFLALLATMMLPQAVTMMPVFLIFRSIGWIDTLQPLWVPSFFGAPYYIFLLRQFFLSIPTELEDAAKIDGCSYYTIFWRIMMPQVKPAMAALTIMAFMASWNDFRGPLIYISSPEKETLAYALQLFQTAHGSEPALLMAASTMMIVPVLALFFFTQRYFIQGITLTGIKG